MKQPWLGKSMVAAGLAIMLGLVFILAPPAPSGVGGGLSFPHLIGACSLVASFSYGLALKIDKALKILCLVCLGPGLVCYLVSVALATARH